MNNSPGKPKIEIEVGAEQANLPLVAVVAGAAGVARAAAQELIERGAVWIDRWRITDSEIRAELGTNITVHFPPNGMYSTVTLSDNDVVFEDRWLLALNKPPQTFANYTPWDMRGTLPTALRTFLHQRDGHDRPIHFAHQLDRDTSGVLLVSKDPAINGHLQALFVSGGISKTYWALASGVITDDAIDLETGHGRGAHGLFRVYAREEIGRVLPFGKQRVRPMHTRFAVIARHAETTLVQAVPITGRTHQIRLHLHYLGHPVVGDARYGGRTLLGSATAPHHLLHAARLGFIHPVTRQPITIAAPLPPTWKTLLEQLGLHKNVQDLDQI